MPFHRVAIASVAHLDPPNTLHSSEILQTLSPTLQRLGITTNVLENVAGIYARKLWDPGTTPSMVATQVARLALDRALISPSQLGLLINTSVSRDFLEPSTASIVGGNLGVASHCQNFDISNACLAFLNGMDLAARMIEQGEVQYALVVDGETAELVYEKTLERLLMENVSLDQFKQELAALTLGSGAAAMVLCSTELAPNAPIYQGGISRSATQWNTLCRGNLDQMVTDTKGLLVEGIKLAGLTFEAAKQELDWAISDFDEFIIHQVSQVHTQQLTQLLGIDTSKVMTIFGQHGNLGPASLPVVLSKLQEQGRLIQGHQLALLGIGSGLNCSMAKILV